MRNFWLHVLTTLFFIFSIPKGHTQTKGLPSNPTPGKCYIRCITPEVIEKNTVYFPIYAGALEAAPNGSLETLVFETKPAYGAWEYQATMDNCQSEDPRDCMVLCFVEHAAVFDTLVVVKDTLANKNFERLGIEFQKIIDKGGEAVWEEVACHLTDYSLLDIDFEKEGVALDEKDKKEIRKRLLKLLRKRPNYRIEINSHTDSRGDAEENRIISQARADAVKNYLVSQGIQASRMVAKGYGESRPVNHCVDGVSCTEEEHAQNLGTEFRVLSN